MVTTKRPGRWIKTLGLFTASVLLLTSLTFTTRAYIIENIVSILLDREIIIDDIVDIETGLLFSATLSGVYMDHSDARFQAEAMFIEMNIIQWLSSDEINLTQLLISNAELHIKEIEEQGQEKEEDAETRIDLIPKEFAFLNMKISYSDEDQDWLAQVASCTGKGHSNSNIAGLTCSGELNGTPFNIMGNYGLPDTEQTTEPLNISVDWGDFSLTAKGKLDSLLDLAGARLDITLSSAHPGPLLRLLGIHELREGAININARIENQTAGEPYEFHIDGSVAGLNVRVDGNTQDIQTLDPIEASFMVSGPSLYEAGALFNELRLTAAPFLASGEFSFSGSSLDIPALNIQLEQGTIEISATAPALPDTEGLQLTITANQFKPNFLKPLAETCELTAEPMDVDAEITLMDNGQRVVIETRSATLQLKAQGTINESPGDINLTVVAESTTMAAIGQCFDVKLPDQPGRASTIVTKKGNLIALSKLRFDSDVAEISGLANIQLAAELSFDTTLHINVPNARNLADGLLENPGSVRAFPFESSLSVHGSEKLLELDDFAISAGKHTGRASGSIGEAFTWHGLDLELTLSGQDLRHLFTDAERKVSQVKPYSLSTTLKNQQGTWVIEQLHASVANSTVNLSARISNEPQYVGSALQVSAEGKNIENLIGHWVDYPLPSLPFSGSADVELTDEYLHFQSLKIIVGEHELTGTLFVDKPPNFSETSGNLTLKGPSVNELAGFMGLEYEFLERNYDGSFLFKGTGQELILDSLEITVGESDLSGWGSLQNTQPPTFELELKSKVLYLPLIEPALIAKEQVAAQATQETSVFSSTELPTQWLTMAEGKLRYDVAEVWTSAKSTASFEVELQLLEGEFRIDEFDWEGESKGQLDLTLKRNHAELDLEMTIESSRLPIVWLFGGEATPSDNTAFHASFDTTGASVKSLMGNLNGAIIFNGGSGKVEAGSLAFLFGDFFHTVSRKIIDRGADSRTNLTCSGGGIQFDNGIARLKPGLVIRTDEVDLFASGEVDLLSEKLHLALITKPGTGIGISAVKVIAPRLTVKGTLAKPSFSVDSKSTAISTYAAFISGGASMLATGLWDRATRSKDPCHDLYKLALKEVQADPMTRK
ncbi:MAG: hypothetical protein VCA12_03430 [Pseudomonadales bacterium]